MKSPAPPRRMQQDASLVGDRGEALSVSEMRDALVSACGTSPAHASGDGEASLLWPRLLSLLWLWLWLLWQWFLQLWLCICGFLLLLGHLWLLWLWPL